MKAIWKYNLGFGDFETHRIPRGGIVRACGIDPAERTPAVWVEVDTDRAEADDKEERTFRVAGTGRNLMPPIPTRNAQGGRLNFYRLEYIGTTFCEDGGVWHCYEVLPHD